MEVKLQVNVYKALPMILEKVKSVALSAAMGKSVGWIGQKLDHHVIKGSPKEFYPQDMEVLNAGLTALSEEIMHSLVSYSADREKVVGQMKLLAKLVCMPYIYGEVLKKKRLWYANRTCKVSTSGRASSFSEDDVLQINLAAMQIANELKSIELVLD